MNNNLIGFDTIEYDQLLLDNTIRQAGIYEVYSDGEYKIIENKGGKNETNSKTSSRSC
ncbi:MAG TPA: hypothetical protein VJ201_08960 [Candidatus Babeliales bacterium]|nr:hypothetical protein [Candidatus Babeliales bacterium]